MFPYWKPLLTETKATFFSRPPSGPLSILCLALSKVWVLKALKRHFMRKKKRESKEFVLRDQDSQYGSPQPSEENPVYLYSRANNSPWALSSMAEFVIVQLGGSWGRRKGEGREEKMLLICSYIVFFMVLFFIIICGKSRRDCLLIL